jgi:hypothetical protein
MNAHVRCRIKTQGRPILQKTDVYQVSEAKGARKRSDYGFILVLICVALALVVAGVVFTPALVGVSPYVGP